jgi:hypothetical protein
MGGTTLRQRLDPRGCVDPVGLATDVPLWGVCNSAAGGLPAAVSSAAETAGGNPPSMRAHALVRARSPVSCARYSACLGKIEEHHSVSYRFAGTNVVLRVSVLYVS